MKKATQSKAWTTVQIARHPDRPQFLDYVGEIFTEFDALHGDRLFGDDRCHAWFLDVQSQTCSDFYG